MKKLLLFLGLAAAAFGQNTPTAVTKYGYGDSHGQNVIANGPVIVGTGNTLTVASGGTLTLAPGSITNISSGTIDWAGLGSIPSPTLSFTGDATAAVTLSASGGVSNALTLATVNSGPGTYGDSTHVAQLTVNGKGLVTAASSISISASSLGALQIANNLSDVASTVTSRANLGVAIGTNVEAWSSQLDIFASNGSNFYVNTTQIPLPPGAAQILIGNAGATAFALNNISGDATLGSTGALTVGSIGGEAVTLAGTLTTSGAHTLTLTTTGNTNVTLPTSGTLLTSNQTITLTGPVTGSGTTSIATTIGSSQVTNANLVNSSFILGSTSVSLGATVSSFAGVTLTSPTFTTPTLGTPASGTLTNTTGFPTANLSGAGTGVLTFLATPSSANLASALTDETGTGAAVFANTPTLVTPALGVATATSINKVAVTAPATSATLTLVTGSTLQTTGAFTLNLTTTANATPTFPTGTYTLAQTGTAQTFAGTQTFSSNPTFSAMTTAGIVTNAVTTGNLSSVVGSTGMATLGPLLGSSWSSSSTLYLNATGAWSAVGGGTTTNALTMNNAGSGAASGSTFNGGSAVTISYNTIGAVPLNGALGTPTSGTATNLTGLPVSTGISGLGTGVATWLATPNSSNLATAMTDETGTGALVFANTPTLVTPVIGAATGTSLSLSTAGEPFTATNTTASLNGPSIALFGATSLIDGGVTQIDVGQSAATDKAARFGVILGSTGSSYTDTEAVIYLYGESQGNGFKVGHNGNTLTTGTATFNGLMTATEIGVGGAAGNASFGVDANISIRALNPTSGTTGAFIVRDASANPGTAKIQWVNNANSSEYGDIGYNPQGGLIYTGGQIGTAVSLTESSNAVTINWQAGDYFGLALNGNLSTVTFQNVPGAGFAKTIVIPITNTASNYTVTWGNSIKWVGGSQPTQTVGVHTDVWTLVDIGGTVYGSVVQNF